MTHHDLIGTAILAAPLAISVLVADGAGFLIALAYYAVLIVCVAYALADPFGVPFGPIAAALVATLVWIMALFVTRKENNL